MISATSIFVIVPCYNEGAVIRNTLQLLLDKGFQVVVVDDASTDDTASKIKGLQVFYIRHEVNLGQGAALETGIRFAVSKQAQWIATFDADGQHDVDDIEKMIALLVREKADIVFGSRFLEGSTTNMRLSRRILLKFARLANFFASGILLSDANNGLRVMTGNAAARLNITENRSTHSAQIQNRVQQNALVYKECPVNIRYTDYSRSKGLRNIAGIRILYELILFKIFR